MALSERTLIGAVTVLDSGQIEVRRDCYIVRDDIVVAGPLYHRHVLHPGDALDGEDPRVVAIAAATWNLPCSHHREPQPPYPASLAPPGPPVAGAFE
jgi:hypothetical protein